MSVANGMATALGARSQRLIAVVILQTGSRGDLEPICLLGHALVAAGHSVAIAAEARFEAFVSSRGLSFRALAGDSVAALYDPDTVARVHRGNILTFFSVLAEWKYRVASADTVLASFEAAVRGADLIVAGALTAAEATCLAEATDKAVAVIGLIPWATMTADYGFAMLSKWLLRCRCSRWLNRQTWFLAFGSSWKTEENNINTWRTRVLGLPRCTHPLGPFWSVYDRGSSRGRIPILIAGTSLLCIDGRPASDWPPEWPLIGPFIHTAAPAGPDSGVPPGLEAFLEERGDGRPVAYMGFGSMRNPKPEALAELFVDACSRAGIRAVISSGWTEFDSDRCQAFFQRALATRTIYVLGSVPHAWIFPRVAVIVHHGGVGTTNAALAAGVPQVGALAMIFTLCQVLRAPISQAVSHRSRALTPWISLSTRISS